MDTDNHDVTTMATGDRATTSSPVTRHSSPGADELRKTWEVPSGLLGFLKRTDHRTIGKRYVVTALMFFLLGGIEALLMRIQLFGPDRHFLNPDQYNQVFTTHGTTMMFLFAVPIMLGMGVYLVPLMLGTRDFAFPRLNAYGYWVYLAGGLFLYAGFFVNAGPDAGWFAYVPLSGPQFSPGKRTDVWAQMITFTELSAIIVAILIIVTTFKLRAPGMSLNRLPLYVWSMLVTSFMVLFAMPAVMVGSLFLALDRLISTHFFNPGDGGDVLLWQHLFWFFGHPEVYIIFIPALGIISTVLVAFCRRPAFGYMALVLSLVSTGFIGFGLWVHHMFATGLPQMGQSFFTAASMMIAVPTGIQTFCWIATMWLGKPRLKLPMLFVVSWFVMFIIGGLSGVMVASVPLDLQVHDTYFVVAHLHYVLIGGALFPLFGGFYFWFPKAYGRMLGERLGQWNFWLMFVGFNLTFFPMHQLGLHGMPRRIYTYPAASGWGTLNLVATAGGVILGLGILLFLVNVALSLRRGAPAGANPWDADGLEWATDSPPPPYNFEPMPTVSDRYPLWTMPPDQPVLTGLRTDRRELLVTRMLDGEPDHRLELPKPSIWPFFAAIGTTVGLAGAIFSPWWVVVAGPILLVAFAGWGWPHPGGLDYDEDR